MDFSMVSVYVVFILIMMLIIGSAFNDAWQAYVKHDKQPNFRAAFSLSAAVVMIIVFAVGNVFIFKAMMGITHHM